jgi:hypothetical protein
VNTNDVLNGLAALIAGHTQKASGFPDATYLYSEGGLFGSCKQDPVLINAMVGPMGYEAKLQFVGTRTENPIVKSLTCIESSGYSQATDCYDCGKPTIYKCDQSACFGRICQQTDEFLFDEIGLMANNQVQQKVLYGNITDPAGNILIGQGQTITDAFTLQVLAAAYNLRRRVGELLWTGNPASNAGGYAEFPGFDLLINTGKVDALNGLACPALDSIVMTFSNNIVGATGSPSIVNYISGLVRSIRYRIMTGGFSVDGSVIDLVMHPTLWDCVADAWACEYGLNCATGAAATNDALAVANLRDQFISGMYLPIDGIRYPVTLDNGISVTNLPVGNETARCSTVYGITRVLPGAPVVPDGPGNGVITYGEYQDMNATAGNVMAWFRQQFGATIISTTDGGRFAVAPTTSGGWCFDARILTKPRIRMLMPQLSGRLTNVCCLPIGTYPDVTGSGGVYDLCGGATSTPENYLYGDCWPTHVGGQAPRGQ